MSQYLGQYWILVCVFFLCLFLWFVFVEFVEEIMGSFRISVSFWLYVIFHIDG